ncbi:uncharacterized protein MONOS_14875 [Monocercomonoides exilis]|uniref:uncharacterized protein n=1 Tax=Monocercomonoides exilis TaxID=2049356 RepID=UPI0035597911|nr:hypothetical protein MONOS_14875 [Monocercomonoides exilis]|eukprot:MONOS_14875.1-p1 / transcript=MONOS_14875.1 / gene=MONOS_14875 / organism=Monocercomonoides_exilis_PA203 / gene_product=unspecified product / transcript_product=unspecified product / location=Mono_scaffold01094:6545-7447(-) / protein_length=301 / sequence_SO=supercontig / SO=protein_coding / is_pseudo=false
MKKQGRKPRHLTVAAKEARKRLKSLKKTKTSQKEKRVQRKRATRRQKASRMSWTCSSSSRRCWRRTKQTATRLSSRSRRRLKHSRTATKPSRQSPNEEKTTRWQQMTERRANDVLKKEQAAELEPEPARQPVLGTCIALASSSCWAECEHVDVCDVPSHVRRGASSVLHTPVQDGGEVAFENQEGEKGETEGVGAEMEQEGRQRGEREGEHECGRRIRGQELSRHPDAHQANEESVSDAAPGADEAEAPSADCFVAGSSFQFFVFFFRWDIWFNKLRRREEVAEQHEEDAELWERRQTRC